jgi:DNA processing protein
MSQAQRLAWLRLARTETIGAVSFQQLILRYGDAATALEALPELARRGGRMGAIAIPSVAEVEAELAAGAALGATLLCAFEPAFPPLLAAVDPPPPMLWARGDAAMLLKPSVAIVGARVASAGGQRFARALAGELGRAGRVVISGLARGIDGAAHEGALAANGGTIAVLAGGVGDVYPPEHRPLYDRIVAEGCVVSERMPGHTATARDFPRRNRIISGLTRGVVVVEAELKSGSLITARLAAEQGREVFAVPGSPLDPRTRGTNDLIRQGATLCEGADDVLRVLDSLPGLDEPESPGWAPPPFDASLDAEIDRLREKVADLLSPTPVSRDEIVRAAGAPAPVVMAVLVELSLAGRASLLAGGLVAAT